jgi:demethylmenaquinone methyltransferase/2-methoxy-6-polyprenyl-1,4-benzoquinol methylase
MTDHTRTENPRRAIFNELAPEWDSTVVRTPEQSTTLRSVIASLSLAEDSVILDVGCGTGVLVPYILPFIGRNGSYTGMDVSDGMIAEANRKFSDPRIRFLAGDIYECQPETNVYDAVIAFSAFPHLHDKGTALDIFHRLLKPGGKLCIVHVDSSRNINAYHGGKVRNQVLKSDYLPTLDEMHTMIDPALWALEDEQDREGLYLLILKRR